MYRSLVSSLLYSCVIRTNLIYFVCILSRFMQTPSHIHLGVAKRVLRYVKGTLDLGVWYMKNNSKELKGYAYSVKQTIWMIP